MSRLEEIKSHEKVIYYLLGNEKARRYFDWLINRVEELERENEHLQEIVDSCRCPEAEHGQLLKGEFE